MLLYWYLCNIRKCTSNQIFLDFFAIILINILYHSILTVKWSFEKRNVTSMGFLDIFKKKVEKPVETRPIIKKINGSVASGWLGIQELRNMLWNGAFLFSIGIRIHEITSDSWRNRIMFEVYTYDDPSQIDKFMDYIRRQIDIV